jgi:hypothetical protein
MMSIKTDLDRRTIFLSLSAIILAYLAISIFGGDIRAAFGLHPEKTMFLDIEQALFFGELPTHCFQLLHNPLLDIISIAFYSSLWWIPFLIGLILYHKDPRICSEMLRIFLLMAMIGFFFYLFFPGYPPWMAAREGLIDKIDTPWDSTAVGRHITEMTYLVQRNDIAPFPSLHVAFSLGAAYVLHKFSRRRYAYAYPLMMIFVVLYSGDHYVIDVLGGIFAFHISVHIAKKSNISDVKNIRFAAG